MNDIEKEGGENDCHEIIREVSSESEDEYGNKHPHVFTDEDLIKSIKESI